MRIIKFFYCLILAGLSTVCAHSQHKDGPYVFYLHDTVAIRSVVNKDGKSALSEQVIINNKQDSIHITIPASDTMENGFELALVKLQKEPCVFEKPKKLFVLSDIEGEFAPLKGCWLPME